MSDKLNERPFHELNQIAQYSEHIRWIVDTYSLPRKAEDKLRLTAEVLDAESEAFEALEQRVEDLEEQVTEHENDWTRTRRVFRLAKRLLEREGK